MTEECADVGTPLPPRTESRHELARAHDWEKLDIAS